MGSTVSQRVPTGSRDRIRAVTGTEICWEIQGRVTWEQGKSAVPQADPGSAEKTAKMDNRIFRKRDAGQVRISSI